MATADALGIAHRLDHRPAELSGGEQQRVAVAQALASGASVVVADEPTAELDSEAAEGVLGRIAELAEREITFVLATHDRSVMSIADHGLRWSTASSPARRIRGLGAEPVEVDGAAVAAVGVPRRPVDGPPIRSERRSV